MPVVNVRVGADDDEGLAYTVANFECPPNGGDFLGDDGTLNYTGLRVPLNVPAGATIVSAKVTFTCYVFHDETGVAVRISYQDANAPADFSADDFASFMARPRSATFADWSFDTTWLLDVTYDTIDITSVIQALVNEPWWSAGENCVLFFDENGSDAGAYRVAYSYFVDLTKAPLVVVEYAVTPGPTPTPGQACGPDLLPAQYKVHLYSPTGTLLAVFDSWRYLEFQHRVNYPGYCIFRINDSDPRAELFEENCIIEVWRKTARAPNAVPISLQRSGNWYVEWEGLYSDTFRQTYSNGDTVNESRSYGYLELLARRCVLWDNRSAQACKTSMATDTAMYEYVYQNCGAGATLVAGRRYEGVITGLTCTVPPGTGLAWSGNRAGKTVLAVLQELALFGEIDFNITGNGGASWTFSLFPEQFGLDRTATGLDPATGKNASGNYPVIFSIEAGNVEQAAYSRKRTSTANVVCVLGQGTDSLQMYSVRADIADIGGTRVNQREVVANGSSQMLAGELDAAGDAQLERLQAVEDFNFVPLRAPSTLYGEHYWWADRITARYLDLERDKRLIGVVIAVDERGEQFRSWDLQTVPRMI